jgi:LCP family protein required for cell wall assembly
MINALGEQGLSTLVGAVESQVGVPVDHVMQVDFDGLTSLVDLVGGIHVRVSAPMRDRQSGLYLDTAGCVRVDGDEALALLRARHAELLRADGTWVPDPRADLARVENQRAVAVATLSDLETRPDPFTANQLADWLVANVTVDDTLGTGEIARLVEAALALDPASVHEATLPVVAYPPDPNRLELDPNAAPAAVAAFLAGAPFPGTPAPAEPPAPAVGGAVTAC